MIRTVKDSMSDLPDEVTPVEGRRLLDQPCQDRFDVSAQERQPSLQSGRPVAA